MSTGKASWCALGWDVLACRLSTASLFRLWRGLGGRGRSHPIPDVHVIARLVASATAYVTGLPDVSSGNEDGVALGGARPAGRNAEATSPITPTAARTTIASA